MQLSKILAILAIAISANAEAGNINTNNAIVARSSVGSTSTACSPCSCSCDNCGGSYDSDSGDSFHKTDRGAPIPAACCFGRRTGLEGAPDRRGLGLALHVAVDACVPPGLARVPGHVDHGLLLKDVALSVAFARHGLEGSHQVPGKTQDIGDALAMWQLLPGLSAGVASQVLPLPSSLILSKVSAKGRGYPSSTAPFLFFFIFTTIVAFTAQAVDLCGYAISRTCSRPGLFMGCCNNLKKNQCCNFAMAGLGTFSLAAKSLPTNSSPLTDCKNPQRDQDTFPKGGNVCFGSALGGKITQADEEPGVDGQDCVDAKLVDPGIDEEFDYLVKGP
ncbi:hypothetical protein M0657_011584 [Pyricularia oryzae]|nr:hypothetical protein M9X92_011526 [Pyricularia oryzae]KAI7909992.1 hypothetical protein M0657_011584 [Pyricularia oryzae]